MSSYYLIKGNGPAGNDRIEVEAEMIVGRSEDCDIRVQDGHPSRRHARLTLADGSLWLEDLGSANGTFVNDRKITTRTLLKPGDRIAFDLATFRVAAEEAADGDATVVRSAPPDPNATVVRPMPAPPPEAKASAAAGGSGAPAGGSKAATNSAPPAKPAAHEAKPRKDTATGGRVPKSWADPEFQAAGTRVLSREELAAMAAGNSPTANPTEEVQGPHLRVISGKSAGMVLRLTSGDEWTIGGDADRDLRLTDEGVSGFHAKISRDGQRWRVIDQMSANGTWVNGEKVTVSYLANGDRLRVAQVECEIRLDAGKTKRPGDPRAASTGRTWLIAAAAAALTIAALVLVSWIG